MVDEGIIARAFQLAQGGTCRTLSEVRSTLSKEGFTSVDAHLAGASIRKQLKAMLIAAR
jgi:hypothetical protein